MMSGATTRDTCAVRARIKAAAAATLLASATLANTTVSATAQTADQIRIGTGGPAGVYFVAGNAICRMVRVASRKQGLARLRCAAPPSGGSIDNLKRLREGSLEFAIVQSDWQYHAFKGSSRFAGRPFRDLRSVFSLHVEPFQIVVGAKSGIENWDGLSGKRVNIGNVGSGHRATFEELVRVHGQSMTRFSQITELGSSDQATALCDGQIDAFAFTVGVPNASIAQATDGCDGRIINLETDAIGRLIKKTGYYRWAKIPEGTYFTSTGSVKTLGVVATLVTRANVPDETVAKVASAVMSNFDGFKRLHPAFAGLMKREMATVGLSAPLHPGAKRWFFDSSILRK